MFVASPQAPVQALSGLLISSVIIFDFNHRSNTLFCQGPVLPYKKPSNSGLAVCSKTAYMLILLLVNTYALSAQAVTGATLNSTGQSAASNNFRFEWSVGESTSVVTLSNGNLVVSTGLLQPYVSYQPESNIISSWLPGEIKVYPNPTKDFIEINILHHLRGKSKIELFDVTGKKVMEKQFVYNGNGQIEKWDLSRLAAGTYFLNVIQLSPVTGRPVKAGAFKILKIQ